MSTDYTFSASAMGVAAQFNRLDDAQNLNHVIPTLGTSVLAPTGGVSRSHASHYAYIVDQPRRWTLLSVNKVKTAVAGRDLIDRFETEVEADVEDLEVVEALHVGSIRLQFQSSRPAQPADATPVITSTGNRIEGVQLGNVTATVRLDEEPLLNCGSAAQLAEFYRKQTDAYRKKSAWRFRIDTDAAGAGGVCQTCTFSLVSQIQLSGPQDELHCMSVDGYSIRWEGFGKIILGEVRVKGNDRSVTMLRLAMGSGAGGSGSGGGGNSNGSVSGG